MRREKFGNLAKETRLAFDMRPPTDAQIQVWWELCKDVPEGQPLDWVRQRLLEAENCPRNLGAEVERLWSAWREAHPEMCVNTPKKCPDCDELGLIYAWKTKAPCKETGEVLYERLMCLCACHPSKTGVTKNRLKAQGLIVMPRNFPRGPLAFEYENGLGMHLDAREKKRPFPVCVGKDLTPDERRFRHLPDSEKPVSKRVTP